MDEAVIAGLTPRNRLLCETMSAWVQAESLLTTPLRVHHGDKDKAVSVEYSRYVTRLLQRWGYDVVYREHPGKGHGWMGSRDEVVRWLLIHQLNRNPKEVRVRSGVLRTAKAHWVRVVQRENPFAFIKVRARVIDRRTILLDTENVLEISLTPGEKLVEHKRPVRVKWNGRDAGEYKFTGNSIQLKSSDYRPGILYKTPLIEGPISDVTMTPFAIVVGTASKNKKMRKFCMRSAEFARKKWRIWQHVEPRFFLDTEISDRQIREYSLQLFGGPDENLVTRKLIKNVPLKITPEAIVVDGKNISVRDAAVDMVYPHPLNKSRYIEIKAANSTEGMFFTYKMKNHMDFVVTDARGELVSGRFDHNWRHDSRYVDTVSADIRAKKLNRKAPRYVNTVVDQNKLMLSDVLEDGATDMFTRDVNWDGGSITLGGKKYTNGLALAIWCTPHTVAYDLSGGGWKRFNATVGIELKKSTENLSDVEKGCTDASFIVRGDNKVLYSSPVIVWNSKPIEISVDITGIKTLELQSNTRSKWQSTVSSINWADARLEK